MGPSPLDKQTASCESPHDSLVSLTLDLVALCNTYVELKIVSIHHLAVFSVGIGFTSHFLAHRHPRACSIGYVSEKIMSVNKPSKLVGNSASYSLDSWCIRTYVDYE